MTAVPRRHAAAALLALVLAGAGLAGCVSLFPKEAPVETYRFGDSGGGAGAPAAGDKAASFSVRASVAGFDREAGGDRILTSNGDRTAFIAGARWSEPAMNLFERAVDGAFERRGGPAHSLGQGEIGGADAYLTLDVATFEARYAGGRGSAPTIVVEIHASLDRGRIERREKTFRVETPAAADTVSAIVTGFGAAVTKSLDEVVAWVDASGAA
jgi:ABC-type uncharacterized transport system auxiliary subunit